MSRTVTVALPRYYQCDALNDINNYFPLVDQLRQFARVTPVAEIYYYFSKQYSHKLPIAALTGLADGIDTMQGFWLRADPVDLQADLNSVYFFGIRHLDMNMTQVRCIAETIRPIIDSYGYELYTPKPYRWYLKLPEPVALQTPAPETMMGASIRDYLTEVDVSWRKLFTEIQMALKQSEVNLLLKREVSGLWFWGGGYFPELPNLPWRKILSDDPVAEGIAKVKQITYIDSRHKTFSDPKEFDHDLIVIEDMYALQKNVLAPLYQALRKRQLTQINLYLGDDKLYQIDAKFVPAWWQFWKR